MQIRRFREGDESELWALFYNTIHRVNNLDYSEEQINAWAPADLDPALWRNKLKTINPFVVESNGEIIGYADLQEDGYINHFYCHHARQRQGVGSLLMEKIEFLSVSIQT